MLTKADIRRIGFTKRCRNSIDWIRPISNVKYFVLRKSRLFIVDGVPERVHTDIYCGTYDRLWNFPSFDIRGIKKIDMIKFFILVVEGGDPVQSIIAILGESGEFNGRTEQIRSGSIVQVLKYK